MKREVTHEPSIGRWILLGCLLAALAGTIAVGVHYSGDPIALGTFRTTNLVVEGKVNVVPQEWTGGGLNLPTLQIDNWAPTGIQTNTVIVTRGADNEGTRISGIDATGVQPGDFRWFVNLPTGASPPTDSGSVAFLHENTSSLAANRIQTPGGADCFFPIYSVIGMVYGGLDGTIGGSVERWHIVGECGWTARSKTLELNFYPICSIATPISGTLDDWHPTCSTSLAAGYGLASATTDSNNYTALVVQTDAGGATLTGLWTTGGQADPTAHGHTRFFVNQGPGKITLKNLNAGSDVIRRFNLPQGRDLIINAGESVWLYSPFNKGTDLTAQWYVIALGASNEVFPSIATTGPTSLAGIAASGALTWSGNMTPTATNGVKEDYAPGCTAVAEIRLNWTSDSTIGGLDCGQTDGRTLKLYSPAFATTIKTLSGASSAANRFRTPDGLDFVIPPYGGAEVRWDLGDTSWHIVGASGDVNVVGGIVNNIPKLSTVKSFTPSNLSDDGSTVTDALAMTVIGAFVANGGATINFLGARQLYTAPRLVPAALTSSANNNDYNPTDVNIYEWVALTTSGAGTATLTGLHFGSDGERKTLCNYGTGAITITHEDAASSASNRFWLSEGQSITLPSVSSRLACVSFRYNINDTRWQEQGTNATNTMASVAASRGAPSANHGSLGTGSTDFVGNVTSVGANTSVTLTYSVAFPNRSWCLAQPNSVAIAETIYITNSASAPVFNCINSTTGAAANCDDFTYQCWGQ